MRTSLRRAGIGLGTLTATATLAIAGLAGAANASTGYHFSMLNNGADPTFNQLLGINDDGVIAGYFGSGAQGHPNKGYELWTPDTYRNENFPHSVQTQVTGLNNEGVTVGFWSTMNTASGANSNFGFYARNGRFHAVNFPTGDNASPQVDQLLGVNNHDVAVGFYTNGQGGNRGYEYDIRTHQFTRVLVPGAPGGTAGPSLTAAAINDHGDVAGFYNRTSAKVDAFLRLSDGRFITLAVPGASMTQAFGVNDGDEVVGAYTTGSGDNAQAHGFVWRPGHGFVTVDDPHGIGATTINGVNDHGDLVGFYTDSAGNTDGMLATP
ncbi:MAG TPA: hypothetical protein VFB06_28750 [Streptosporangiaceae bacterium]|nr:hypothetical protein [Streptosporangiaceae bacterium]